MSEPSCGVMHCVHWHEGRQGQRTVDEAIKSASLLRQRMRPAYPMALFANMAAQALVDARGKLALWDIHRPLKLPPELRVVAVGRPLSSFVLKLAAMYATHWNHTLFLDNDMTIQEPSLVHSLLSSTLHFSDLAAPVVPGRHKMLGEELSAAANGAPLLCSCMMAYQRSALPLLLDASKRLSARRSPALLRQGDQEYIWLAWTQRFAHLRVMPLPEDYYCPTDALREYYARAKTRCKAIHQHAAARRSTLWYVPNRTLIFSDALDLARSSARISHPKAPTNSR